MSHDITKLPYFKVYIQAQEDLNECAKIIQQYEILQKKAGKNFSKEDRNTLKQCQRDLNTRMSRFESSKIGERAQAYSDAVSNYELYTVEESSKAQKEAARRGQTANNRQVDLTSPYSMLSKNGKSHVKNIIEKTIPKLQKKLEEDMRDAQIFKEKLNTFNSELAKAKRRY